MRKSKQQIVEEQIKAWRAENQRPRPVDRGNAALPNAIVLSYAPFLPGADIATRVAKRLGIPHYDHEILEKIAKQAQVRVESVESLDRHVFNKVGEYVATMLRSEYFERSSYTKLLKRTVLTLWKQGPSVLSGHGANHLVPREHSLTVRLIAPFEIRAARLAAQHGLKLQEAEDQLRKADEEQRAFHRRLFNASIDDLEQYDLVIDTSRLECDALAELVSRAYGLHFGIPAQVRTHRRA